MARPFKTELVIEERIATPELRAYYIGFDQQKFRLAPLVDVIRSVIPEFSLGYHSGKEVPLNEIVNRLKEAADTVYQTDKYQKRGEFGELILHLLLRDFCETIPLISKIYFKDSYDVPAHGFDGVQVSIVGSEKKLWLGESKLYKSGSAGIRELAEDIKKHVNEQYLRKEFNLISKKLPECIPEIEYWRNLMDRNQRLDTIFSGIVIPMVCTYSSEVFTNHCDNTSDCIDEFEKECQALSTLFNSLNDNHDIEIILMLLPVQDKDLLTEELDRRLKAMQSV